MSNRISLKKNNQINSRLKTITNFLKKDTVDSFITKINKQNRKSKSKSNNKVVQYLSLHVKPKIKDMMYSHQIWGDQYYKRVLKKADLTENFFESKNIEIHEKNKYDRAFSDKKLIIQEFSNRFKNHQNQSTQQSFKNELKLIQNLLQKKKEKTHFQLQLQNNCYDELHNRIQTKINQEGSQNIPSNYQLLQKCRSYKHVRHSNHSQFQSNKNNIFNKIEKKIKPSKSTQKIHNSQKNNKLYSALKIIADCEKQEQNSPYLKSSLNAFSHFCNKLDRKLQKRSQLLSEQFNESECD